MPVRRFRNSRMAAFRIHSLENRLVLAQNFITDVQLQSGCNCQEDDCEITVVHSDRKVRRGVLT